MSELKNNKEFTKNLLAQDQPSPDRQLRHQEALFKKLKRRAWLGAIVTGAVYIVLFLAAFWAFLQRSYTDNVVHSICWGAVSLHILLWFLVYFLRGVYRMAAEITEKNSDKGKKQQWRNQDRFITIWAILIFALSTFFLYRDFSLDDPLKAAHAAPYVFWAAVFFIFWYPFGTASLLRKLWLEYKKMELNITKLKQQDSKSRDE